MPSVRTSSAGHHSLGKRPSCCRTRGRGALTPNWRCNCVIVCARKLVLEREGRKPASFNAWAIAVAAQPASVNSCTGLPDLRIGTQLAQLANRSDHNPLGVTSSNPLDMYPDPLAVSLDIHDDRPTIWRMISLRSALVVVGAAQSTGISVARRRIASRSVS